MLEIDEISQAARIQGGVYGPALESQLKPSGLTLRHFPQSFEFSTLGGWIATRGGGHYATLYTHIDEFVESLRVVTPAGVLESFRLPGSGAGPSPDRMFIGSEGTLGIITEAWMRLRPRPTFRAATTRALQGLLSGGRVRCARIAQAHLYPANCRLVDADEALVNGAGDGTPFDPGAHLRVRGPAAGCDTCNVRWRSCVRMAASTTKARSRARTRNARAPPASGATASSACPTAARC